MKKSISFVLVLTMVLSIMAPMVGFAEGPEVELESVYNQLQERFKDFNEVDFENAKELSLKLVKESNDIVKNLTEEEKTYLKEKGLTEENISNMINKLQGEGLSEKILSIKGMEYKDGEKIIKEIEGIIYNALPDEIKEIIERHAPEKQTKINLFAALFNEFKDEEFGTGNHQNGKYVSLNIKLTEPNRKAANAAMGKGELLTEQHSRIANKLIKSTLETLDSKEINTAGNLLEKAGFITKNPISTPTPSEPGTGGGTVTPPSTPSTPSKPSTTITEKDVKVETVDGVVNVTIKEKEAIAVIKGLRKEAGKDKTVVAKVELDSVEGENLSIDLTAKTIKTLLEEKVDLNIITKDIEYLIPYNALPAKLIPEGSIVRFRTDKVDKAEVKDIVEEHHNTKKVIDIYLEIVKDDKITKISKFDAPITVKVNIKGLGNKDKLAVYFFNEEDNSLEFVTGKIEGNNAVLLLDHFSKYVVLESNKTFLDITNHWSKLYVESMAAKNVVDGYTGEIFKPENNITRGEFAKLVVNALEEDVVKYNGEYSDVKANDWYADYVATMNELGLIKGYGDGSFKPEAEITRAEIAMILAEVVEEEVTEEELTNLLAEIKDNKDIPDWARESVAIVLKSKVMIGNNEKFSPVDNATRAESATTMYRVY